MYGDFNAVQLLCIAIESRDVLSRVRLIIRKHLHEDKIYCRLCPLEL